MKYLQKEKVMDRVITRLNHCDCFSHYCASLAEEERKKERSRRIRPTPPPPPPLVCRLAGVVLQRRFLATPTVLLLMKTLEMS